MMLSIHGLYKQYGRYMAVNGLTLEVEEGTIFGFVGPNGAGKTTTMRIITTLLPASGGTVSVDGVDVSKSPWDVRMKVGYMPDFFGVYDNLRVSEYLDFYGACYDVAYKKRQAMIEPMLELVDLLPHKEKYVDTLSRGMKQRLCLARCLMHDPKLLVLDEPASGMDPRARAEMKGILRQLREMGKTIMISPHILPELAEMCDTVGILDAGRLKALGSVSDIQKQLRGGVLLRVQVLGDGVLARDVLREQPGVQRVVIQEPGLLEMGFDGDDTEMAALLRMLVDRQIPVVSFNRAEGNLEQIFMEITAQQAQTGIPEAPVPTEGGALQ